MGARGRIGAGVGKAGALAFFLAARRMMERGPGRAGALSFFLGAMGEGGGGQQHVRLDTAELSSLVTKYCGRSASPAPSGRGRGRC